MDPEVSDDQRLFGSTTARFVQDTCPLPTVRALVDDPAGVPPGYLEKAGALGWFSLLIPEDLDGGSISGNGLLDLTIVAEERGRFLQPGAVAESSVVAAAVAVAADPALREQLLPRLMSGAATAALATAGPDGDLAAGAGVHAVRAEGGVVLTGAKGFVQDAHLAEWLLVEALLDGAVHLLLVPAGSPGVSTAPLTTLDVTRRLSRVRFDGVAVPVGHVLGDADLAAQTRRQALVLALAESVGAMDRLFEVTVQYAKDRRAFGRPIGSFQAVKHQLADLGLLVQAGKAIALAAARAVQEGRSDADRTVSTAKAYLGDAGIELSQGCLQVHGGIGYTWEYDLHLYLRRLASDAALHGDPVWHRERLVALHGF